MFGCPIALAARASRTKRSATVGLLATAPSKTLSATAVPSSVCFAWRTTPMPPRPITFSTR